MHTKRGEQCQIPYETLSSLFPSSSSSSLSYPFSSFTFLAILPRVYLTDPLRLQWISIISGRATLRRTRPEIPMSNALKFHHYFFLFYFNDPVNFLFFCNLLWLTMRNEWKFESFHSFLLRWKRKFLIRNMNIR